MEDEFTNLYPGDKLPSFSWFDKTGEHNSDELYGKSLLAVFFTLNCNYCRKNFYFLNDRFHLLTGHLNINLIAFGREQEEGNLGTFIKEKKILFPLIADPDAIVYTKFAQKIVPRNYIFNEKGTLTYQMRGFSEEKAEMMIDYIEKGKGKYG